MAALTRQFRDLDLAEDAFGEACIRALARWPKSGVPRDPFAWLLTTARNAGIDQIRKSSRVPPLELMHHAPDNEEDKRIELIDQDGLRDDILRLLFVCCHPALGRQDQLALALKIVAGLSVPEIARAFLIKPKTMEQRLTRAKKSVAANPVPFETPSPQERGRRLNEVSLMIYLLFNEGWSSSAGSVQIRGALCDEAIRLARLLLELFPAMAEQMSLLALMLFQHARKDARMNADGDLVALEDQDRSIWDRPMMAEGFALLDKAARHGPAGPYQVQARIAGLHAMAKQSRDTNWAEIAALYERLYHLQPTPVVRLNQAAAIAEIKGPLAALAIIEPLRADLEHYRWFHTAVAEFRMEIGDFAGAVDALRRALDLHPTAPERAAISGKITVCEKNLR